MRETDLATDLAIQVKVREFDRHFVFETYGVTIKIESNDERLLQKAKAIAVKSFLNRLEFIENESSKIDYSFGLRVTGGGIFQLYENGSFRSEIGTESVQLEFFTSYMRAIVAERATPWVFVHAGAVAIKGRAIIIPGSSYSGKTTLVAELIKLGAEYYSDEYAVLDENGMLHAFPRDLSMRSGGDWASDRDVPPQEFGAAVGSRPASVGLVILTNYADGKNWDPVLLTQGNGIKEMIAHTVSVRFNTAFGLNVLNRATENAIILKGERGDSRNTAVALMSFMNTDSNWS